MQKNHQAEQSVIQSLDLCLLGGFKATLNGAPLPPLRTRKGGVLLALLALKDGQPLERNWLAGTLWPDSAPEQALYNLRQSLSDLRRALGPGAGWLYAPTARTLLLRPEGVSCDALRFDALTARGDAASWEAALSLYNGPLLSQWDDECLLPERHRREEAYLKTLHALAQHARDARNAPATLQWSRRLIEVEPQQESNWQNLMRVRAASGDYAGMTQTYRRFRLYLHDALSTSPAAETTALYQKLRGDAAGISPPELAGRVEEPLLAVNGNLPPSRGALIGREREVADIRERMQSARLITLTGAGGIGKTRLALTVAAEMAAGYPHGAWWVDLAALTEGRQVPQAAASALGLREVGGDSALQTLLHFSRQKRLLLVLDNCEHLLKEVFTLCEALLSHCPAVHLLTTSRQSLSVSGEHLWHVPPLPVPDLKTLPASELERLSVVQASASARLFVAQARTKQQHFALTVKNALPIARICAWLEGLPLALELAAARVNVLSVEQIAERLDNLCPLLTRGSGLAARQQTLRALVDWSYTLLSDPEKTLLRRSSVFRGGWTLEATRCWQSSEAETLDLLSNLNERSLVLMETTDEGAVRYRLLETIRQYASEKLCESSERGAVHRQHARYFLSLAEARLPCMNGPDETLSLNDLEREYDNLRAALCFQCQEDEDAEAALRLIVALRSFWSLRGHLREGLNFALNALAHPGARQPKALRAQALAAAGNLALGRGDYTKGAELLEEAVTLCRMLNERATLAAALNTLAAIRGRQGNPQRESVLLHESLTLQKEIGSKAGMALVYSNLCSLARKQGNFAAARAFQKQSLTLGQEIGDKRAIVWSLNNLGAIAVDQANYTEARAHFERSLSLCREVDDKVGVADILNDLGCIAQQRGEYMAAWPFFEESLTLREARGDRNGVAISLDNQGVLLMRLDRFEEAENAIGRSLALCRDLAAPRGIATAVYHLGDLAVLRNDYRLALTHYEESLTEFENIGDQWGMAYCLNGLGQVLCALKEWQAAYQRLTRCLRLCEATENKRCAEYCLENSAHLIFLTGDPEKALRLYSALDALRQANDHPLPWKEKEEKAVLIAQARARLTRKIAARAWDAGQQLTMSAAIVDMMNTARGQPPHQVR